MTHVPTKCQQPMTVPPNADYAGEWQDALAGARPTPPAAAQFCIAAMAAAAMAPAKPPSVVARDPSLPFFFLPSAADREGAGKPQVRQGCVRDSRTEQSVGGLPELNNKPPCTGLDNYCCRHW